jgi:hypothetical protein
MRKRREVDCSKLEVWRVTFERGRDYFSDLAAVGVTHWIDVPIEKRPAAKRAFMAAA